MVKNYRQPSMEEFMNKVIFTCQDCIHSSIKTVDKKSFIICSKTATMVEDNATCDAVMPLNLNTDD